VNEQERLAGTATAVKTDARFRVVGKDFRRLLLAGIQREAEVSY